jgi:hypothetical protein
MSPQAGTMLVQEVAPRLRTTTRHLPQVGADDAGELYADGIAIAAGMLDSAERKGKAVTAGNIAYYATKQLAGGRRSTFGGRADAVCPAAQLDGKSRPTSIQAEVGHDPETGESVCVADLVSGDAEDPAQAAARNLDWGDFLSGLDGFSRKMLVAFARGDSMRSLKTGAGVSDSAMRSMKRKLAAAALEHFGEDCLADAGVSPGWLADVAARREKEACRREGAIA